MHRRVLLVPLLAALACRPTAKHRALATLAPPSEDEPMMACVDAVLAGSPLVERVTSRRVDKYRRSRYLVLRNPPGPRSTGLAFAVEPERGTPRELVVEFAWPGRWQGVGGMQPPPDPKASDIEGETLRDIAAGFLRDVRAHCAPTAPGEPACSRIAQGRSGRCVLGA